MNLIDLSEQERAWYDALTGVNESGEPLSEEQQAHIIEEYIAADEAFKGKVDRYCELIEAFSARAEYRQAQAARLNKLSNQDASVAKRMTDRLKAVMILRGEKRIETEHFKPHVVGNGGVAPLIVPEVWRSNPALAPAEFQKTKEEITLDLILVRQKLAAGETVEGCKIGERGTRLVLY